MDDIGAMIRDRRKELGLTQTELASRLGFNQGHLSRIEKGRHELTLSQLKQLEHVLDCSLQAPANDGSSDLFGLETLYQLSVMHDRTQFQDMFNLIQRAGHAEFFLMPKNASRLMFWKGRALGGLNRSAEARDVFQAILDSGLPNADMSLTAMTNVYLGFALHDSMEYTEALKYFEKAQEIHQRVRRLQFDAEFLYAMNYGLATTYTYLNRLDEASHYLARTSTVTADQLRVHVKRHARTLYTRGSIVGFRGNYEEALALSYDALRHFELVDSTEAILHTKNNIAFLLKMMGRHEESSELYDWVLNMARRHPEMVNAELRRVLAEEGYEL